MTFLPVRCGMDDKSYSLRRSRSKFFKKGNSCRRLSREDKFSNGIFGKRAKQ